MKGMVLKGCNLVDMENNRVAPNICIALKGDSIEWVREKGEETCFLGYEVVDVKDKFVLPGLWDMHVHLNYTDINEAAMGRSIPEETITSYRRALTFLQQGVTTIRLTGSDHDIDLMLRDSIDQGVLPGPSLLTAGRGIASTGGHGSYNGFGFDGPIAFRKATRELLHKGVDFIKIMVTGGMSGKNESFDGLQTLEDEVKEAITIAHNWGKHVAGHVASSEAAIMCSQAGMDTIEHGYTLDAEAFDCMVDYGTAYVPTLCVTHRPLYWEEIGAPQWAAHKIRQAQRSHHQAVTIALEKNVAMCIGTDLPTAWMDGALVTIREMEALEEMGAKPHHILQWATRVPAEICGLRHKVSAIKEGMQADLIVVEDNPLQSMSSLRTVLMVIARGKIHKDLIRDQGAYHHPYFIER